MPATRTIFTLLTAAIVATLSAGHTAQACEPMQLFPDPDRRTITFHDHGAEGPSSGDMRIGHQALHDGQGADAGYLRWVITSLGEGYNRTEAMFELPDGHIHSQHLWQPRRSTDGDTAVLMREIDSVIVGGTGAYTHARGTIRLVATDNAIEIDVDVRCD